MRDSDSGARIGPNDGPHMATLSFDTLRFANRLKAAGIPSAQAEAEAQALSEVFGAGLQQVATQQDVIDAGSALRRELRELELRIEARFAGLAGATTLLKWMIGVLLAVVASLVLRAFF